DHDRAQWAADQLIQNYYFDSYWRFPIKRWRPFWLEIPRPEEPSLRGTRRLDVRLHALGQRDVTGRLGAPLVHGAGLLVGVHGGVDGHAVQYLLQRLAMDAAAAHLHG